MLGAQVMPHNIYLHSALVQKPRMPLDTTGAKREAILYNAIESGVSLSITVFINLALMAVFARGFHGHIHDIQEVGLNSAGRSAPHLRSFCWHACAASTSHAAVQIRTDWR
jgi:natural resistance-associated macrophage protein 2